MDSPSWKSLKKGITRPSMSSRSKVEYLLKFKMAETAILNSEKCSRLHKVQPSYFCSPDYIKYISINKSLQLLTLQGLLQEVYERQLDYNSLRWSHSKPTFECDEHKDTLTINTLVSIRATVPSMVDLFAYKYAATMYCSANSTGNRT